MQVVQKLRALLETLHWSEQQGLDLVVCYGIPYIEPLDLEFPPTFPTKNQLPLKQDMYKYYLGQSCCIQLEFIERNKLDTRDNIYNLRISKDTKLRTCLDLLSGHQKPAMLHHRHLRHPSPRIIYIKQKFELFISVKLTEKSALPTPTITIYITRVITSST